MKRAKATYHIILEDEYGYAIKEYYIQHSKLGIENIKATAMRDVYEAKEKTCNIMIHTYQLNEFKDYKCIAMHFFSFKRGTWEKRK